jgi:hypothetical protein
MSKFLKYFFLLAVVAFFSQTAFAQFEGATATFYRDGKDNPQPNGNPYILGDPISSGPVELEFKGGEYNVYFQIRWNKPLAANFPGRVLVTNDKDEYKDQLDPRYFPKGLQDITHRFILRPGNYRLKLVHKENPDQVYFSTSFSVIDKVGTRVAGNQKAGQAQFWVCGKVDDDWNPVDPAGDAATGRFNLRAGQPFEILIKNGNPFGTLFLGIVIHKQGPDGKDTDFVDEFQTDQLNEQTTTKWATEGGLPGNLRTLSAGTYTIYVINWYKRQVNYHPGNFTDYYSKATVVVR